MFVDTAALPYFNNTLASFEQVLFRFQVRSDDWQACQGNLWVKQTGMSKNTVLYNMYDK